MGIGASSVGGAYVRRPTLGWQSIQIFVNLDKDFFRNIPLGFNDVLDLHFSEPGQYHSAPAFQSGAGLAIRMEGQRNFSCRRWHRKGGRNSQTGENLTGVIRGDPERLPAADPWDFCRCYQEREPR